VAVRVGRLDIPFWGDAVTASADKTFWADTFDILSGVTGRDALWLEAIEGFDAARRRMSELAAAKPGPFFIFHTRTAAVVATADTTPPKAESHNPRKTDIA
jgi:hypothetical protein